MSQPSSAQPDAALDLLMRRLREQVQAARASGRRAKIEAEVVVDSTGRVVSALVKPPWIDCAQGS